MTAPDARVTSHPAAPDPPIDDALLVRVLGPVEVCHGDRCVVLPKPQLRTLLAVLTTRRDRVITIDELMDVLWGESPPGSAHHAIQVLVSTLRNALDEHGGRHIVSEPPGYRLRLAVHEYDAALVAALHDRAHVDLSESRFADASQCLRTAERLWKGPPYAEFQFEDWALADIRYLNELRWNMIEDRVEAELALGLHHELVPELEWFATEQPSRERLLRQLMVALVRSDRPVDAIATYEHARTRLAREYGCEPGPAATDLAARIRASERV